MDLDTVSQFSTGIGKDVLDELFVTISRLIVGISFGVELAFLTHYPSLGLTINSLISLKNFSNNPFFYLFSGIFCFLYGALVVFIFDALFDFVVFIFRFILRIKVVKDHKYFYSNFNSIFNLITAENPLNSDSKYLNNNYKNIVIKALAKAFNLRGVTTYEVGRLSKQICIENRLIQNYRYEYFFDLFKGIVINLLILSIFAFFKLNFLLFMGSFLLVLILFFRLKEKTMNVRIQIVDAAYLRALKAQVGQEADRG